jgi:sulfite reductase (NADPH) hemoprotein beta-component
MKALTANRLIDGEVVFWKDGRWVERFADAQLFGETEHEAAEAAEAHGKNQPTVVVEPYLIDLTEADGLWAPVSFRERIRALGPPNHPGHGKQAEGGAVVAALQNAHGAARSTGRVNLIKRK